VRHELKWIADLGSNALSPVVVRSPSPRRKWMLLVGAVVLLTAALSAPITLYLHSAASGPVLTRLDVVTPPTSDAFSFAISPDGRQLAFVGTSKDATVLWVRPFDQGTAQPLAGTEGAEFPFWSPDSRSIGFFADGKLKRIDRRSGTAQVIADATTARGGAWSREGVIVVGQGAGGLTRVSASGGVLTEFTHVTAGQNNHRWPNFLPDGRVLFFATGEPGARGVYVTSIEGGNAVRVMDSENAIAYAPPGHLLRVSQGTLAAYPFDLNTTPHRRANILGTRNRWR